MKVIYVLLVLIIFNCKAIISVPLSEFYDFGPETNDAVFTGSDDDAVNISLKRTFNFYNQSFNVVHISNNGLLSFRRAVTAYTSDPFPLPDSLIAPFWADVDTRGTGAGNVYYRESIRSEDVRKVAGHVVQGFPTQAYFEAESVVITTWDRVGYFDRNKDKLNTFQCIIATDGLRSYVIFQYLDNGINWVTGDESGGRNGFGGTEAYVGFNAGGNINAFYAVNNSRTPAVINIADTSNVGIKGLWIFQVNFNDIMAGGGENQVSCGIPGLFSSNDTAIITFNSTIVNSTAAYTCADGYILIGNVTRTCMDNKQWSGEPPLCLAIPCGPLNISSSNEITAKVTMSDDNTFQAIYSCNEDGYQLFGSEIRTCLANNSWSDTEPCCGILVQNLVWNISNTTLSVAWSIPLVQSSNLTELITHYIVELKSTQNSGFTLRYMVPTMSLEAEINLNETLQLRVAIFTNIMNPFTNATIIASCGIPGLPSSNFTSLEFNYNSTIVYSRAVYTCGDNYTLVGTAIRTCMENRQWSGNPPQCQIIDCGEVPVLNSTGDLTIEYSSGTIINSIAKFRCNTVGYELAGTNDQLICQNNQQWNGTAPYCQLIDCGSLSISGSRSRLLGGLSLSYTTTTYSSIVTYDCTYNGYQLIGDSMRTCTSNKTWSGLEPYCGVIAQSISWTITNQSSLLISWELPTQPVNLTEYISHYVVEIKESNDTIRYSSASTMFSVNNITLDSNSDYTVRVAVYTDYLNPFSDFTTVSIQVPTESPTNINITSVTPTSIMISWRPPAIVTSHNVSYIISLTSLATDNQTIYSSDMPYINITDLRPYTTYTCKIAVQNIVGKGPYSSVTVFRTSETAPSVSPNITSFNSIDSKTLRIQWNTIPTQYHNGIIRYYIINLSNSQTGSSTNYTSTSTSVTIGLLQPSYTYQFSVAAYTVDSGPFSTLETITMPEDIPSGEPQSVTINNITSDSISINWYPPDSSQANGVIIEYVINITNIETSVRTQWTSNDTNITIINLEPHTIYGITIAAVTSIGSGPFTELILTRTEQSAPNGSPRNLRVSAINSTAIQLDWDTPLPGDHNGVIKEYYINITAVISGVLIQNISSNSSHIIITSLRPFTIYYCSVAAVTNDRGPFTDVVTVITKEDVPEDSPMHFHVTDINSTSISLSWLPPNNDSTNGIIRYYTVLISDTDSMLTVNTSMTFITVYMLNPFTNYTLAVAAYTVARGPYSDNINVTTLQDVPSNPPRDFNGISNNSTSLTLSWSPPESSNGIIKEYEITITEQSSNITSNYTTSSEKLIINDLHPYYIYTCTVTAVTIGQGPVASIIIQMPEDKPSLSPSNIRSIAITSRAIQLTWNTLPVEHQNGLIRHYILNITVSETNSVFTALATNEAYTLQYLHPHYTYSISVAAYTIDHGPFSYPAVTFVTKEETPSSSPVIIDTIVLNSTSVYIRWLILPPSTRNGIITGYRISLNNIQQGAIENITTTNTSVTITTLDPFTLYSYRIAALNSIGRGPFSQPDTFTTAESVPSTAPISIIVSQTNFNSIIVSWSPPTMPNGIITSYAIALTNDTGEYNSIVYDAINITITNLTPRSLYNVRVAAATVVGTGPFSTSISIVINDKIPTDTPSNITYELDGTTLKLSWKPPSHSSIIDYQLNCTDEYNNDDNYISVKVTQPLAIVNVTSDTIYECEIYACNSVGCGPKSITYISTYESGSIGPPMSININTTGTSIYIQWEPPYDPLNMTLYYVVSYNLESTPFDLKVPRPTVTVTDINSTEYIIEPVLVSSMYRITVHAVTDIGNGMKTKPFTAITKDSDPNAPQNFTCIPLNSTTINCTWVHPKGVFLQGYELDASLLNSFNYYSDNLRSFSINNFTNNKVLHDLSPYAGYIMTIKAIYTTSIDSNETLTSRMTTAVLTLPSISDQPVEDFEVNILSPVSVIASWIPPSRVAWKGNIQHYIITIERIAPVDNDNDTTTSQRVATLQSVITNITVIPQNNPTDPSLATEPLVMENVTINNLEENFDYELSVSIVNDAGRGKESNVKYIQTPQAAPSGPPQSISLTNVNTTGFTITWSQPDPLERNGIITGYTVMVTRNNTNETRTLQIPPNDTTLSLQGFLPYETITVKIAASTVIGIGPFSNNFTFKTSQEIPSNPLSFNVSVLNLTAVELKWKRPARIKGVLLKYQVIYSGYTETSHIRVVGPILIDLPANVQSYNVTKLRTKLVYHFKVRASTGAGYGPNSTQIIVLQETTTGGAVVGSGTTIGVSVVLAIIIVILLCVICLCIVYILYKRRRHNKKKRRLSIENEPPFAYGNTTANESLAMVDYNNGSTSNVPVNNEKGQDSTNYAYDKQSGNIYATPDECKSATETAFSNNDHTPLTNNEKDASVQKSTGASNDSSHVYETPMVPTSSKKKLQHTSKSKKTMNVTSDITMETYPKVVEDGNEYESTTASMTIETTTTVPKDTNEAPEYNLYYATSSSDDEDEKISEL